MSLHWALAATLLLALASCAAARVVDGGFVDANATALKAWTLEDVIARNPALAGLGPVLAGHPRDFTVLLPVPESLNASLPANAQDFAPHLLLLAAFDSLEALAAASEVPTAANSTVAVTGAGAGVVVSFGGLGGATAAVLPVALPVEHGALFLVIFDEPLAAVAAAAPPLPKVYQCSDGLGCHDKEGRIEAGREG